MPSIEAGLVGDRHTSQYSGFGNYEMGTFIYLNNVV